MSCTKVILHPHVRRHVLATVSDMEISVRYARIDFLTLIFYQHFTSETGRPEEFGKDCPTGCLPPGAPRDCPVVAGGRG